MRVFIYNGGLRLVGKSGVGQAIFHQREMLRRARIETSHHWLQRAGAVHINPVLPDSVLVALADILLARPDESIAQVAAACGFDSPSNFSQQFRRFYRCTPREYRLRGAARQQP